MLLSIIMPLASSADLNRRLIKQLCQLPDTEILICGHQIQVIEFQTDAPIQFIDAPPGRAQALNQGASLAHGEFLWFLHADSFIDNQTLQDLLNLIHDQGLPSALYYFDLDFVSDHQRCQQLLRINSAGVYFRSRILLSPFGDQAFLISRKTFSNVAFPETASYGEDHLFVWLCRQRGIAVKALPLRIGTSGRKYEAQGWSKTSCQHIMLWLKQWLPEVMRYLSKQA